MARGRHTKGQEACSNGTTPSAGAADAAEVGSTANTLKPMTTKNGETKRTWSSYLPKRATKGLASLVGLGQQAKESDEACAVAQQDYSKLVKSAQRISDPYSSTQSGDHDSAAAAAHGGAAEEQLQAGRGLPIQPLLFVQAEEDACSDARCAVAQKGDAAPAEVACEPFTEGEVAALQREARAQRPAPAGKLQGYQGGDATVPPLPTVPPPDQDPYGRPVVPSPIGTPRSRHRRGKPIEGDGHFERKLEPLHDSMDDRRHVVELPSDNPFAATPPADAAKHRQAASQAALDSAAARGGGGGRAGVGGQGGEEREAGDAPEASQSPLGSRLTATKRAEALALAQSVQLSRPGPLGCNYDEAAATSTSSSTGIALPPRGLARIAIHPTPNHPLSEYSNPVYSPTGPPSPPAFEDGGSRRSAAVHLGASSARSATVGGGGPPSGKRGRNPSLDAEGGAAAAALAAAAAAIADGSRDGSFSSVTHEGGGRTMHRASSDGDYRAALAAAGATLDPSLQPEVLPGRPGLMAPPSNGAFRSGPGPSTAAVPLPGGGAAAAPGGGGQARTRLAPIWDDARAESSGGGSGGSGSGGGGAPQASGGSDAQSDGRSDGRSDGASSGRRSGAPVERTRSNASSNASSAMAYFSPLGSSAVHDKASGNPFALPAPHAPGGYGPAASGAVPGAADAAAGGIFGAAPGTVVAVAGGGSRPPSSRGGSAAGTPRQHYPLQQVAAPSSRGGSAAGTPRHHHAQQQVVGPSSRPGSAAGTPRHHHPQQQQQQGGGSPAPRALAPPLVATARVGAAASGHPDGHGGYLHPGEGGGGGPTGFARNTGGATTLALAAPQGAAQPPGPPPPRALAPALVTAARGHARGGPELGPPEDMQRRGWDQGLPQAAEDSANWGPMGLARQASNAGQQQQLQQRPPPPHQQHPYEPVAGGSPYGLPAPQQHQLQHQQQHKHQDGYWDAAPPRRRQPSFDPIRDPVFFSPLGQAQGASPAYASSQGGGRRPPPPQQQQHQYQHQPQQQEGVGAHALEVRGPRPDSVFSAAGAGAGSGSDSRSGARTYWPSGDVVAMCGPSAVEYAKDPDFSRPIATEALQRYATGTSFNRAPSLRYKQDPSYERPGATSAAAAGAVGSTAMRAPHYQQHQQWHQDTHAGSANGSLSQQQQAATRQQSARGHGEEPAQPAMVEYYGHRQPPASHAAPPQAPAPRQQTAASHAPAADVPHALAPGQYADHPAPQPEYHPAARAAAPPPAAPPPPPPPLPQASYPQHSNASAADDRVGLAALLPASKGDGGGGGAQRYGSPVPSAAQLQSVRLRSAADRAPAATAAPAGFNRQQAAGRPPTQQELLSAAKSLRKVRRPSAQDPAAAAVAMPATGPQGTTDSGGNGGGGGWGIPAYVPSSTAAGGRAGLGPRRAGSTPPALPRHPSDEENKSSSDFGTTAPGAGAGFGAPGARAGFGAPGTGAGFGVPQGKAALPAFASVGIQPVAPAKGGGGADLSGLRDTVLAAARYGPAAAGAAQQHQHQRQQQQQPTAQPRKAAGSAAAPASQQRPGALEEITQKAAALRQAMGVDSDDESDWA